MDFPRVYRPYALDHTTLKLPQHVKCLKDTQERQTSTDHHECVIHDSHLEKVYEFRYLWRYVGILELFQQQPGFGYMYNIIYLYTTRL